MSRRAINTYRIISTRQGDSVPDSKFGKHLGYDYATPINTAVIAPISGIILSTPYTSLVGNQVFLKQDDNGWIHRFLHLNGDYVSPGQRVTEGQVIALSGNTGSSSTGPHLHHDVRKANTAWDESFYNYIDWEAIIKAPVANPVLRKGATVFLMPHVSKWRFYAPNVQPKIGRELGYLNPAKFGGLTYTVLAVPFANTATIQTSMFGKVNIYIDKDAKIS